MVNRNQIYIEASLTGNRFNGHYNYCWNLSKEFSKILKKDFAVWFVLMNSNKVFKAERPLKEISYRWYKYLYRLLFPPKIWHITYQLTDLLPSKNCDILLTIHDLNFLKELDDVNEIEKNLEILQSNIDRAKEITTISQYVKEDIIRHCNVKDKNIHVIYNGGFISEDKILSLPNIELRKPNSYILSIGVIARKKNIHVLPYLLIDNDLELVICGFMQEEDYLQEVFEIANYLGVRNRVVYLGPVNEEEKLILIRDCAIFAFPSKAEGFGLPIVEAMSFGKKVLLSTHTCLPEIGGDVVYYIHENTEAYMKNFAKNDLPNILSQEIDINHIRNRAKMFTWEKAALQYKDIYLKLLNG